MKFLNYLKNNNYTIYPITQLIIFLFNLHPRNRFFITNLHLGNSAEEVFLNTCFSYLKNQKICHIQNFFFSNKTNKNLSLIRNTKAHYSNPVIKFFIDFIFTVEFFLFYFFLKSILKLFFSNSKYIYTIVSLIQIQYTGKKINNNLNKSISKKVFLLITSSWFFPKYKDEKNYLKKKFQINFNKKIIVIHNRTKAFYNDDSYRNTNSRVFKKTIDWLISHDYFVIFMGENKFKFKNSNFLNYYNTPKEKIDDILIIKNTDYVLCSPSGPSELAYIFNRKIIIISPDVCNIILSNPDSCHIIPKIFFKKKLLDEPVKFYLDNIFLKKNYDTFPNVKIQKINSSDILNIMKKYLIISKTRKDRIYSNYIKKKIFNHLFKIKYYRLLFKVKLCKGYYINLNKFKKI